MLIFFGASALTVFRAIARASGFVRFLGAKRDEQEATEWTEVKRGEEFASVSWLQNSLVAGRDLAGFGNAGGPQT